VLVEQVYGELHRMALGYLRHERPDHTLEAAALVHETYLLLRRQHPAVWRNRFQFLAVAARLMRRVLLDHARRARYAKRGGGGARLSLVESRVAAAERPSRLGALDHALSELAAFDAELAGIVEARYFRGLTAEEIGAELGVSVPTVTRRWRIARGWLHRRLTEGDGHRG
jgi:RNA polymerase sigma factor (TIGR02999 family)